MNGLQFYKERFASLSVKVTKGLMAPHKAVMLLTIMDLIRDGSITENKIFASEELKASFVIHWDELIGFSLTYSCSPWTPYWHMGKECFWHFRLKDGFQGDVESIVPRGKTASIGRIRRSIDYASLDDELFQLLTIESNRLELAKVLQKVFLN